MLLIFFSSMPVVLCRVVLQSENPSDMHTKCHNVAASDNEITCYDYSIIACLHHLHVCAILRAHPVRGELPVFNTTPTSRLQQLKT